MPKHKSGLRAGGVTAGACPADSIPHCLAVMGATPKGLAQALSQHHEDAYVPDGDTTENISKIIYNRSLALFRKDEAFRKWKRRHRR